VVVVGLGEDPASRLEPVDVGHLDVHEHDVGMPPADEVDCVATVPGPPDDADPGLFLEDRSEARSHERLIVGDQHGHGFLFGSEHGGTVVTRAGARIIPRGHTGIIPEDDGACGRWL
jgi:hypothetical protein